MQQLNEDEERKKVTLAKQHEVSSRIAAITKSPKSFAFGSSTPRTLAYLDNLPKSEQQYDKKLRPLDQGPSQTTSPTSTTVSFFKIFFFISVKKFRAFYISDGDKKKKILVHFF